MKKLKSVLMSLIIVVTMAVPSLGIGLSANAYTVEKDYIGNGAPVGYTVSNDYIILHEAGNPSNTGADSLDREVSYMKRNWQNAFVNYFVGGGGRVVKLAQDGAYQYGAGAYANGRAYAQIELARTKNKATFQKDYKSYVNLARDLAKRSGIPKTLDGAGKGIKSHQWISLNIWGDHMDPYSYLASMGISKAQFAKDIEKGIGGTTTVENTRTRQTVNVYWFTYGSSGHKAVIDYCKKYGWSYKEERNKNSVKIKIGTFNQNSDNKFALEKWLASKNYNYDVTI